MHVKSESYKCTQNLFRSVLVRKSFRLIILIILVVAVFIFFLLYKINKYQNQNTPIDAISVFYSKMEDETMYKVISSGRSSNTAPSELPKIYRIYMCVVSIFNKFEYPTIGKELKSYSFLISNNNKYDFSLIAKTINNRVFDIDIIYDDCSLKIEIGEWINYLTSNLPELGHTLNSECRSLEDSDTP